MKQVLQHPRTGEIEVLDVPAPQLLPGCVLVRVAASLVSAGTERAASEFASKNLLLKAKARPDLVREVINKVRRDGISSTVTAVRSRLDQPLPLGYSSSGYVIGVGEGVTDIKVGDRVACAGGGLAVHAEIACIPRLLLARIPYDHRFDLASWPLEPPAETSAFITKNPSLEEAAFATVGAVALHGIRTAEVKLGELVAVIGLGLLGQLTVQLLKAAGCRVLGMDIAPDRAQLALKLGADGVSVSSSDFRDLCLTRSVGVGVDAVLIAAETPSSAPVNLAAEIARDRAIVVAVGTVGMDIERKLYYEKELDFRVSRSYGPGRYDSAYEQKGRDYPLGYVRWTETRNMEAFLGLLSGGRLNLAPLITHRFPVQQAERAYDIITGRNKESFLGVLITYPQQLGEQPSLRIVMRRDAKQPSTDLRIGLLGAGTFATGTLLPAVKNVSGVNLVGVCSATGPHCRHAAEKFGFSYCTTEEDQIFGDPSINTVVIATRHHLHARQVLAALRAGKNVFCEKPLCLNEPELVDLIRCYIVRPGTPQLLVGFNRRFAPMAVQMQDFLSSLKEPLAMHYRVNAGFLPRDHWVNDPEQGGGRILGEVCHFVDFLSFLAGSSPLEVDAHRLSDSGQYNGDNVIVSLRFANGSHGTVSYLANGDRSFSKERVEVFAGGAVAVLDDFRRLELIRNGRKQVVRSRWHQDKGHRAEWQAFAQALRSSSSCPIPFERVVASTLATLRIQDSVSLGQPIATDAAAFMASVSGTPALE